MRCTHWKAGLITSTSEPCPYCELAALKQGQGEPVLFMFDVDGRHYTGKTREACQAMLRASLIDDVAEITALFTSAPTPGTPEGWQPPDTAPKDSTLLLLLVEPEQCATEDGPLCRTIGGNNFDNDGVDRWQFAGWDWCNDRFIDGIGKVLGWMPLPAAETLP